MRPYLDFLTALAQNNHKDWMDANKKWYLETKERFLADVAVLLKEMTELEPELSAFKPKDCVFRQNRDVRFSANKDPYKTNFGAYFSPGGKSLPFDITCRSNPEIHFLPEASGCLKQIL